MIGNTLTPAIQRVERIAGVRSRNDPFVVRLVQSLIDQRMVQSTMDPVDTEIRERDEQGILEIIVERERSLAGEVVELGVSLHLGHEERRGQRSHDRHSLQRLFDLERNLVAQELGMLHSAMVVDEIVGDSRADEVEDEAEDPVCGIECVSRHCQNARKRMRYTHHIMRNRLKNWRPTNSLGQRESRAHLEGAMSI